MTMVADPGESAGVHGTEEELQARAVDLLRQGAAARGGGRGRAVGRAGRRAGVEILGVTSRTAAVAHALTHGLLS